MVIFFLLLLFFLYLLIGIPLKGEVYLFIYLFISVWISVFLNYLLLSLFILLLTCPDLPSVNILKPTSELIFLFQFLF